MNIANIIHKPLQWFNNRSFLVKLILSYVLCGVLPMAFMMYYYYSNTTSLLMNQSYLNIRQDMAVMNNSLNSAFQPYETVIETLKNDKNLNTLLGLDYTDISYSDLAYYADTTLDNTMALYPGISWIHFYSNNSTLPMDNYYFYPLSEISTSLMTDIAGMDGSILATDYLMQQGQDEIMLISRMNYYSTNRIVTYIAIGIDSDEVSGMFYGEQLENCYLVDDNGIVLSASDTEQILTDFSNVVSQWESLPVDEITEVNNEAGDSLILLQSRLDMGMTLIETVNENQIYRTASQAPLRMLLIFIGFSLFLLLPVVYYSRQLNARMKKILTATEKIGSGDFTFVLEDQSKDEFGQISRAVSQMSGQIDSLIRENYQKELENKISELNLLQEQINPHFLYNALAVISSMAMRESAKQTMLSIRYLANFYRISLNKGRQVIYIQEEIDLLKNYMEIQMIRFSDILTISYDIAPEIENYYTVKLLLQPVVENAIKHGREEDRQMNIIVRGYQKEDRVCFDIDDDGVGMSPETLASLREELQRQEKGFGLKNIDRRIKLAYGENYGVTIDSMPDKGTKIHMEIPIVETR